MVSSLSRPDRALQTYFEDPCLKHAGEALRVLRQHSFSSVDKYRHWFLDGGWVGTPLEPYWYWVLLHSLDGYLIDDLTHCCFLFQRAWHVSNYPKYRQARTVNPENTTFFVCDEYWCIDWRYVGHRLDALGYSMTHWSDIVGLWDSALGAISTPADSVWQNSLISLHREIGGSDYKIDQYSGLTEIVSSIFKVEFENVNCA